MSYSYSTPVTYGPQVNNSYSENSNLYSKKSAGVPAAVIGSIVGGGTGAVIGYKKNPLIKKDKNVSDTFAKTVYDKYIQSAQPAEKDVYNESINILKNIKKMRSTEDLKALFEKNKKAANSILSELNTTPEKFFSNINENNLNANKQIIQEKINASNKIRYQDIKNKILACWDKDKKEFIKNNSTDEKLFEAINKAAKKIKLKAIGKFALIGAAVTGIVSYIGAKLFIK